MTSFEEPKRHLNRIYLNGGPRSGEILEIDDLTAELGYLKVYIPPSATELAESFKNVFVNDELPVAVVPIKIGTYRRDRHSAGTYNTCEFRVWYEWHWQG